MGKLSKKVKELETLVCVLMTRKDLELVMGALEDCKYDSNGDEITEVLEKLEEQFGVV